MYIGMTLVLLLGIRLLLRHWDGRRENGWWHDCNAAFCAKTRLIGNAVH